MKLLLLTILLFLTTLAQADSGSFPRSTVYTSVYPPYSTSSNATTICNEGIAYLNDVSDPWNPEYTLSGITSSHCNYSAIYTTSGYPNHTFTGNFTYSTGYSSCPSGTTQNGTNCDWSCSGSQVWNTSTNSCQSTLTCTPPLILNEAGTACVTDCSSQNGKLTGSLFSPSDSSTYCYNGCTVQVNNSVCVSSGCAIDGKYTNTSCSTETATTPETPESKCLAKGMSYGTINNQVVCVESGTAGTPPLKSKDTNVSNTTTNDGSGDVETTKEVSREYDPLTGKVTTTTTTTTPSGTTTETKQEDKKGFCEENPDVTICKGGSFSGSCANSFSCDGDAVQCATALHLHRARCKDSQDLQSEFATQIQEGMDIMNGENSTEANAIKNRDSSVTTTIDLENEISESGDITFSAECFDDLTITVLGQNIVIPISSMCQYLEMMGYILLALAYLSALRIVGIF